VVKCGTELVDSPLRKYDFTCCDVETAILGNFGLID
jgi:hypothetical protein